MPPTRSSQRQLLGEQSHYAVPLRRSRTLKKKELLSGRVRPSYPYISCRGSTSHVPKELLMKRETGKEIAEIVLCEYNKKHGTDLELLRVLDGKEMYFFGPGCSLDFAQEYCYWWHLNIEARLCSSGPHNAKPLLLFVESNTSETNYLSALSLVAPTDKSNGCQKCWSFISHPRYGFRAGFDASTASDPKQLLEDDAVKLSQLALQDYNEKHGTNLKLEKAFGCNSFTCTGITMDFAKKSTRWVHVNFEARVGFGDMEQLRRMFAELYVDNDDKYVIATLSPAEPEEQPDTIDQWTDGYPESECAICPGEIRHPWRAYRFGFDYPPRIKPREEDPFYLR